MIARTLLMLTAILPMGTYAQADIWNGIKKVFVKEAPSEPSVRVLLVHDKEKVHVEVQGKYSLYDPYKNEFMSTRFIGKARNMETMSDGLKWGEAFPGVYQLQIQPEEPSTVVYADRNEYSGPVLVYDIGNAISIVNKAPLESYVGSIVSNYDLTVLDQEVISAMAIVARTNACFQAAHPKTAFWDVDAFHSGYKGNPVPSANSSKAQEAARLTRNMIMSNTGVYEGVATPFAAEFGPISPKMSEKQYAVSKISLEEANDMARAGAHAAQILAKAFPGSTIMLNR